MTGSGAALTGDVVSPGGSSALDGGGDGTWASVILVSVPRMANTRGPESLIRAPALVEREGIGKRDRGLAGWPGKLPACDLVGDATLDLRGAERRADNLRAGDRAVRGDGDAHGHRASQVHIVHLAALV